MEMLSLSALRQFGFSSSDIDAINAGTGKKNNPVQLEPEEIRRIIEMRL